MVQSINNYIKKQNQLTSELKGLNEQLQYKDRLKDQFINIAAHELRTPNTTNTWLNGSYSFP